MHPSLFSRSQYIILFLLLAIVYIIGLFIPLMDNDSAHHANIALRMYLTGDYVNLVDHGKDYLDKPHLHFWLSAFSYSIFGVTGFAYKFPSFLFTVLGTYSTYRLGKVLYNNEVGKLAALIVASSFAYMLANNDVRMDAILTASIIFATWQLVEWVNNKTIVNALGAALGLALGFCTKGHIAVFTPAVGILFYIFYKKDWKSFYHPQLLLLIFAFCVFISPVVYCYYLQFDLHPEKIIRGKSGHSGVKFILWGQNFERFQGDSFGADAKNDYFFFFHSFLWAFAPWSVLTFIALLNRLKGFANRRMEWLTIGTVIVMALLITFSGFKLPHYLNIIFPVSAVLCSSFLVEQWQRRKSIRGLLNMQIVICVLCLLVAAIINVWAFPATNVFVIAGFLMILFISGFGLYQLNNPLQKLAGASVITSVLIFYLLNTNFYPQLLSYQAGNEMAVITKGTVDAKKVFFWPGIYSSSYNFYTVELRKEFADTTLQLPAPIWIMTDPLRLEQMKQKGLRVLEIFEQPDYEITMMQLPFINPATRKGELTKMILVRVK
ncbi:MAG: glycosyltransferase family 39 protein [Bacteroidota bacterium]|nr:glycosyltransferase family 39 protein [Bacteroidota bacterium]